MSETKHLLVEDIEKYIVLLTLSNPEQKNAITFQMIDELEDALSSLEKDPEVRVVILRGAGDAFCAGGDVKAMKNKTGMFFGDSPILRDQYIHGIQRIPRAIEAFQKPLIAMVNGAAVGAGCDLSMMCDLRVGSEKSNFSETFNRLGLVPGDGGTFFLQRVIGYSRAMNMFLTAKSYKGQEAYDYGLLNYIVSHDKLLTETLIVARNVVELAPIAVRYTKRAMKLSYLGTMEDSLESLATYQAITQRTHDHEEAVNALLEKRKPNFKNS